MSLRLTQQLKQRLILGSLGTLLVILAIYFSHSPFFRPLFVLSTIVILNLALLEYYNLAKVKGFHPLVFLGLSCATFYTLAVYLSTQYAYAQNLLPAFILLEFLIAFFLACFSGKPAPLANLAITLFGIGYITMTLSCALQINYLSSEYPDVDGRLWLAYVLMTTKMTDVGGYFVGKGLGRKKLAPTLSPKKTLEGMIGGMLFSLLTSLLFYFYFRNDSSALFHLTFWQSIGLSLLISLTAQFGDLAESLLKRDAGVKDSSHLPGLGGILDIVDSLVFTIPLMYLILKMSLTS